MWASRRILQNDTFPKCLIISSIVVDYFHAYRFWQIVLNLLQDVNYLKALAGIANSNNLVVFFG